VDLAVEAIRKGGRAGFYIGRRHQADAWGCSTLRSACPPSQPTAWWRSWQGSASLTSSVEEVEDDSPQAVRDLKKIKLARHDLLVGISAGGGAPYVLGGMRYARKLGAKVVGLTCNPEAPLKGALPMSA